MHDLNATASIKQAIQHSQFDHAVALADEQLTQASEPQQPGLLYLKAVAQRLAKQFNAALATLDALVQLQPDYGRGYQEQGYCLQALGQTDQAASAFYQATRFNPALVTAWKQLIPYYERTGNQAALAIATEQLKYFISLERPLLGACDLMHEGQLHKAEQVCRQFLQQHKHHSEAMMLLAEIGLQLKVYHDAEFLLESCVALYPDNERAARAYQALLLKLGKYPQALALIERRLANNSQDIHLQLAHASALTGVGQHADAITVYQQLLAQQPDRPSAWVALGHVYKTAGQVDDAIDAYRTAAQYQHDFGDAYWSLANMKTYRFDEATLSTMQSAVAAPDTRLDDAIHLHFALGKAYEDSGDTDRAFSHYARGNGLKARTQNFDITRVEQAIQAQQKACDSSLFNPQVGCADPAPIFIVGLPRAGSTLLEQILASHSQIDGTMELHDILGLASRISGQQQPYPYNLASLTDAQCEQLGRQYIEQTRAYREGAPFFIDKMPNNFIHIGLIKRILPNAKIIDARREPLACCFSGFKQLFGDGQEFSYSLSDIGRYYTAYEKLMDHWHSVLPGQILTVQHEDVLDDLEGQVTRMLEYLGLPFEPACLKFYASKRAVNTPSAQQVRQPIFQQGRHQHKAFTDHLAPLFEALGRTPA